MVLAAPGLPVVGVPERTALIRDPDGSWRQSGVGKVQVFVDGHPTGMDALPVRTGLRRDHSASVIGHGVDLDPLLRRAATRSHGIQCGDGLEPGDDLAEQ